jgi:hypothetical protein
MARSRKLRRIWRVRVDSRSASALRVCWTSPAVSSPELNVAKRFPQRLDRVAVELAGPVRPAAQPAGQPIIKCVADRVGRAGPDPVVELLAQLPELGL